MYKKMCATPTKINIYNNPAYAPLPMVEPGIPPPAPIFRPKDYCGQPYQTPMYHPPYCMCKGCTCKK